MNDLGQAAVSADKAPRTERGRRTVRKLLEAGASARERKFTACSAGPSPIRFRRPCTMRPFDPRIAMPRLETPRLRVAAGSVGIAGQQTGIYPCETPGGWCVIGRTSTRVFDPGRGEPFLLKAGDNVKFVAA